MSVVIVDNKPDASVVKRCICRNCGVTLEYTPADTTRVTVRDYGGGSDVYKQITCPKCSNAINTL